MILKTDRDNLILRTYKLSDAEAFSVLSSNKNIWKFLRDESPYPCSFNQAQNIIQKKLDDKSISFAISYDNNFVGEIQIKIQTDILRHSCLLGYWLGKEYWGKGIITNSVNTIVKYCFEVLKLKRIVARVFSNNIGSIKVLEKCNFEREGYFKNAVLKENLYYDQIQYAILK